MSDTPAWAQSHRLPPASSVQYVRDALSALVLAGLVAYVVLAVFVHGPSVLLRIGRKQVGA